MAPIARSDRRSFGSLGFSVGQNPMSVCYRIERLILVLSRIVLLHGGAEAAQSRASQTRRDGPMFTRAQFLRLSSVTVAALAVAPEALSKSNDGVVRVKSVYSFQDTV